MALLFAGDEVSRIEVTAFLNCLTGIAERRRIGLVLSTHVSKSADGSTLRTASGSTAWINASRSVLHLEAVADDPDKAKLTLIKANHAKPGLQIPLLWQDAVLVREPEPDALERRLRNQKLDRTIFQRVEQAWAIDNPLSAVPQAKDRYLPVALSRSTEFNPKELAAAMNMHMDAGHLAMDRRAARSPRGLKVAQWPDSLKPQGE